MIAWSRDAVDIAKTLHAQNPALYDHFGSFRSNMLSLVRADGALDLYDGVIRARDADGALLFDGASDQGYLDLIEEEVKPWTYMKFPFLKSLGREHGWYRVGPLARLQNCDFIPSPLAEASAASSSTGARASRIHGTLAYHWARMIELLHCMEVIAELLDDPDILAGELMASGPRRHSGVGVIEAPRGTLIHHYEVGDDDLVTMLQPDRQHHPQQPGHERGGALGGARVPRRPGADRRPAQPHRGGHPRLRPLPVLRHARAGQDAAGSGAGRCRRRAARSRREVVRGRLRASAGARAHDAAAAGFRLGQPQPRRRCAGPAVRGAAARELHAARRHRVPRRLPADGRARARPAAAARACSSSMPAWAARRRSRRWRCAPPPTAASAAMRCRRRRCCRCTANCTTTDAPPCTLLAIRGHALRAGRSRPAPPRWRTWTRRCSGRGAGCRCRRPTRPEAGPIHAIARLPDPGSTRSNRGQHHEIRSATRTHPADLRAGAGRRPRQPAAPADRPPRQAGGALCRHHAHHRLRARQLRQFRAAAHRRADAVQGAEPDPPCRAQLGLPGGQPGRVRGHRAGAAAARRALVHRHRRCRVPEPGHPARVAARATWWCWAATMSTRWTTA